MKRTTIRLHLESQPEGGYTVTSPDVPDLITEGETVEECLRRAREVAELLYQTYLEHEIPLPAIFRPDASDIEVLDTTVEVGLR